MTNEVTLLPCPFCGRSDTTRYGRSSEFHEDCCDGDGGNDDYVAVFCDASEPRGLGGCGASSGFAKTYEEAAARWNRRPVVEPEAKPRKCMADMNAASPRDCNAPYCDCNPAWGQCIEMLQEIGWKSPEEAFDEVRSTTELTVEQLKKAVTGAMDALSNGRTEDGARILRECFWLGEHR